MNRPCHNYLCIALAALLLAACTSPEQTDKATQKQAVLASETQPERTRIFERLSAATTGIQFANNVEQTDEMNMFTNYNVFNGGGVAVGDLNNDGLPDAYFTANQGPNALYINRGNLQFENATEAANAAGNSYWATGVCIVDVNADGWNDVFVCHAGNYLDAPENLANEVLINNGDAQNNNGIPTFTDQAKALGLAGFARTMHVAFFDMDNDNDLDVYVANHPYNFLLPIEMRLQVEKTLPEADSDRLYRNDNGTFTDITDAAGIKNWAFALSVSAGDMNGDGFTDLFVCNDYSEKDFYYVNNGDGTFSHQEDLSFRHISNFSMGSALGDINNDARPDLFALDMMAEDNRRKKVNMSAMKPEVFWDNVAVGRHYQYMQNVLQVNYGNPHGRYKGGLFGDVAELAGVAYTDWSWSALMADLDNDGWQDLFVTNGIPLDFRNADQNKAWDKYNVQEQRAKWRELLGALPSEPVPNYAYQNRHNLTFDNATQDWGLHEEGFSNGAAFADLDLDGDLDLLINNLQATASVYKSSAANHNNWLQIAPTGPAGNPQGIGLKVRVQVTSETEQVQYRELSLAKGFQSGGEAILHLGLGAHSTVARLEATWPDGAVEVRTNVQANQRLALNYADANQPQAAQPAESQPWLADAHLTYGTAWMHGEEPFDDYVTELLLPHKYSQLGPCMATADINGDGLTDVFIGGASDRPGLMLVRNEKGTFGGLHGPWEADRGYEDTGCCFFDANNDGLPDLYVCSGSNEWPAAHPAYEDRLYLNQGNGNFEKALGALPTLYFSSGCAVPADFDADGDMDLFVGGRLVPGAYPSPATSRLLINNGGTFTDGTPELAPMLNEMGMVTSAQWLDYDADGLPDLAIAGEWMPVTILRNTGNGFENATQLCGLDKHVGWWYSLHAFDADGDGDTDLMAGNLGLNAKYQGTMSEPFEVYYDDFDQNGTFDIVLSYHNQGVAYPVRGRSCSSEQMPNIKKKFPSYEVFSTATMTDVYGEALSSALHYKATWMASSYLENTSETGQPSFKVHALPNEAQLSAVNAICRADLNGDGAPEVLLAGNMYNAEIETCRHDASIGMVLTQTDTELFSAVPATQSGFVALGDVKAMAVLQDEGFPPLVIVAANSAGLRYFEVPKPVQ